MKKKIIIGCISLVFMLLTISVVTAIGNETQIENNKEKISPLFKIRTSQSKDEQIQKIQTNLIGDRIFFLPFTLFKNNEQLYNTEQYSSKVKCRTYHVTSCTCTIPSCTMPCDSNTNLRYQLNKKYGPSSAPLSCDTRCWMITCGSSCPDK